MSAPDVYFEGLAVGRMVELSPEKGTVKVDLLAVSARRVRQALAAGVRVEIEQAVTPEGAPTGPPRYILERMA